MLISGLQPDDRQRRIRLCRGKQWFRKDFHVEYYLRKYPGGGWTDPDQWMSLADNKGKVFGLSRGTNKARIDYYREQLSQLGLGLEDKMDVKVGALSGGQRQAMALLMSTMTPIEFLILDEHTAALDPKTAELIMELTDKIVKEKNLTTIMVTHNLRYAIEYGNRLVMMHQGNTILDKKGEEKDRMSVDDILTLFNEISIECGN